jgi:hypothetical protein
MKLSKKIIQTIPLSAIWTDQKEIQAKRITYLTSLEIITMLRASVYSFVVADIGQKLKWVDEANSFDFWKSEIKQHLTDFIDKIETETFPNGYAYVASKWVKDNGDVIILLEKYH